MVGKGEVMGWKYFNLDEFQCKCGCGRNKTESYLTFIRVILGFYEDFDKMIKKCI
jgi:hypothetical protein